MLRIIAQQRQRKSPQQSPGQAFNKSKADWERFFGNPLSGAEQNAQELAQWRNTTRLPVSQRGSCSVCGRPVAQGQGMIDEKGLAGKGLNALLCPQDAYRIGLRRQPNRARRAQFSGRTLTKTKPATPKGPDEGGQSQKAPQPGLWNSFWAGYDAPQLSYEDWKKRYWAKNRKLPSSNWLTNWLKRKSRLPGQ